MFELHSKILRRLIMAKGLPNSHRHIRNFQSPLRFGKDGKFRILHLTDIHEVDPEMDDDENRQIPLNRSAETINVIRKCVELAKPDLVVFGGDNISGYWEEFTYDYMRKTIKKIVEPIAEKNIPLAIVFGNHDAEAEPTCPCLAKENQISVYCEYDNFRGTMNDEDVHGCGNYNLPILSSDGKHIAWNVWCIDSNDYVRDEKYNAIKDKGYGFVFDDQIEWYERKSAELRKRNGGKAVPSVLFQHIPVLQEYERLTEVAEGTPDSVGHNGRFYVAADGELIDGALREGPCPPDENDKQFKSWKKTGDIIAAFFGHDHKNTFTMDVDGIKLVQTPGAGYHTYGDRHGGRLIVLDENKPDTCETENIFIDRITDGEL